jgi:ADP-heptose:LPS heptosyltransferase
MKIINLKVPQGVGDIFWIYQKFAPYFDKINFHIGRVPCNDNKIATRAISFLKLLPKTGDVQNCAMSDKEYTKMIETEYKIEKILADYEKGIDTFLYACNKPLEKGTRIEKIDENHLIEKNVEIKCDYAPLKYNEKKYVCVYISGTEKNNHSLKVNEWGFENWVKFIRLFYAKYSLKCPIIFVGASYDKETMNMMENKLKAFSIQSHSYCDSFAGNVTYIIKNSICFIGFQSGLNILADNLDTKQIMMYFPFLEKMQYAWAKQENIDNNTYNSCMFNQKPEDVVSKLKLVL